MAILVELTERKRGSRCCADTGQLQLSASDAQQISEDLQILGHPVRLQLLTILARSLDQVCVCDLEAAVPVKQPTVSHHLRLLREAGLIDCERRGLWAYYFARREALAACVPGFWGSWRCWPDSFLLLYRSMSLERSPWRL